MFKNERILAFIGAGGGSKGLRNKNVLDFGGKPLIQWTVKASLSVNIPVIAHGGCGRATDIVDVINKSGASAAAVASILHYGCFRKIQEHRGDDVGNTEFLQSAYSILKNEMEFNVFLDGDEVRNYVFDFVEVFNNRKRTYSYLGYVSPEEFENQAVV